MSQYYSDYIVQQKGKEVVKDKLQERLQQALDCFAENHKREFPTNLIIYRDGVGDAQREQVFAYEIEQFQETIEALYNKVAKKPEITVCFVNKRIN